MSKLIQLGESGAYGIISVGSAQDMIEISTQQNVMWTVELNRQDGRNVQISADQSVKWDALSIFFSSWVFNDKLDKEHLYSLISDIAVDFDLVAFESEYYIAKSNISRRSDVVIRDPDPLNADEIERRLSEYRSAAIALRSMSSGREMKSLSLKIVEQGYEHLATEIAAAEDKVAELMRASEMVSNDIILNQKNVLAEIELVREKSGKTIGEVAKKGYEEIVGQSGKAIASIQEYQRLIDAAKTAELMDDSVRGWTELADAHSQKAVRRIWAAGIAAVLTIVLTPAVSLMAFKLSERVLAQEAGGVPRLVFAAVTALMCLTFGIWATRIAIRSYMTEEHLKNDSANRVSITNAFIKLQKSLKLADEDRKILLQTIMRPATDGIVQDDGLPQGHPAAMLVQLIDPKKPIAAA